MKRKQSRRKRCRIQGTAIETLESRIALSCNPSMADDGTCVVDTISRYLNAGDRLVADVSAVPVEFEAALDQRVNAETYSSEDRELLDLQFVESLLVLSSDGPSSASVTASASTEVGDSSSVITASTTMTFLPQHVAGGEITAAQIQAQLTADFIRDVADGAEISQEASATFYLRADYGSTSAISSNYDNVFSVTGFSLPLPGDDFDQIVTQTITFALNDPTMLLWDVTAPDSPILLDSGKEFDFVTPDSGSFLIEVVQPEQANHLIAHPPIALDIDVFRAPGISLMTPANGETVASPATLSGTANDDTGVNNVELVIYNAQLQTWDGTAFTSAYTRVDATLSNPGGTNTDWTFSGNLPDGTYNFRATAVDVDDITTNSPWRQFSVFSPITVTSPESNGDVVDQLAGTANDETGVSNVELVIYNAQLQTWDGMAFTSAYTRVDATLSNPGGTNTDWTYNGSLPDGTYTLRATAIDVADNTTDSPWRQFTIDSAPSITVTSPESNGDVVDVLAGTANDGTGVSSVELVIYNDQLQTWDGTAFSSAYTRVDATLSNPGGTNTGWTYNVSLPDGSYTFRATAVDLDDNTTNSPWRQFTIDDAAPSVTITAPSAGNQAPNALTGTAEDNVGVLLAQLAIYNDQLQTWDGTAFTSAYTRVTANLSNPGGANTDWIYDVAALPVGNYIFRATVLDAANNQTNSNWFAFQG